MTRKPAPAWTTDDVGGIHGWVLVARGRRAFVWSTQQDDGEIWTVNVTDVATGKTLDERTFMSVSFAKEHGQYIIGGTPDERAARRLKSDITREKNVVHFTVAGGNSHRWKQDAEMEAVKMSLKTPHQVHVHCGGKSVGYAHKGRWYPS